MITINTITLVTRNARDKIQVAQFILSQEGSKYIINRYTGQFGGVMTSQPEKVIEKGKVKRSVLQQAELEFNSLVKKSLDKGYKNLSELTNTKFNAITSEELDRIVPTLKTDSTGKLKPQLAKSSNDCALSALEKQRWCSRKLDGVRCSLQESDIPGKLTSGSRGGQDYDPALQHLLTNQKLIQLFKENPGLILDGEIYVHGWPLQKISGTARLKTFDPSKCGKLEYWIYDIVDTENSFNARLDVLDDIRIFLNSEKSFNVIEHILLEGWEQIKRYHDKFVSEGFEGLVARNPDKKYSPGKRNSDWIKVKQYMDDEFEITGFSEGLRDEDMCFTLKTKTGKIFKAKPVGDREVKYEYLNSIESLIGKKGTVTFFSYSEDGVPMQPVFKSVREEGE